ILIVLVGWYITDKIVEPRLSDVEIDGDEDEMPEMEEVTDKESRAFWLGFGAMMLGIVGLFLWAWPEDSALRDPSWDNPDVSSLFSFQAPLMQAIVPLIF
ncbi:MAG TPA: aminobenzoyl-glutamate transporter, partial [Balneolaceae bacterium]|nr:aminobenzoyl-glutamate transporter [Balneolaceae bacterium]